MAAIDAARRWLVGHPRCTGRVGLISLCMGGGFALAGHGFMSDRADGELSWWTRVDTSFDAEATSDAQARILAFFEEHLG